MSIYSEYKVGALSYEEFRQACREENVRAKVEMDEWVEDFNEDEDESEEE